MNLSPGLVKLFRTLLSMAIMAVGMAILPYLADITHLTVVMPQWLAFMISSASALILQEIEANKGQAGFGAVKTKQARSWEAREPPLIGKLISVLIGFSIASMMLPVSAFADNVQCECVRYLHQVLAVDIHGDAKKQIPNYPLAGAGVNDVLLFNYSGTAHVGLIVSEDTFTWTIAESNYRKCTPGTRVIAKNDPHIKGAIRPHLSPFIPFS